MAVVQVEAPPGEGCPGAIERVRIRRLLERGHAVGVVVFSDFMRTREVWQWEEVVGGVPVLREASGGTVAAAGALPWSPAGPLGGRRGRGPAAAGEVEVRIVPALVRRLVVRGGIAAAGEQIAPATAGELAEAIRGATAEQLRAVWRELQAFSVLDPACGGGVRLAAALELLGGVRDAVLERMAALVSDLEWEVGPRARALQDFRHLLERLPTDGVERRRTIHGWVLIDNLFGADPSAGAVRRCRARLRRRLGDGQAGARALLRLDIRRGVVADAAAGLGLGTVDRLTPCGAELETVGRVSRILRRAAVDAQPEGWPRAVRGVEARLRRLEREIRPAPAGGGGSGGDAPLLDVRFCFAGRGGGSFDVILFEATPPSTDRTREESMPYPLEDPSPASQAEARTDGVAAVPPPHVVTRGCEEYPERVLRALGAEAPDALHLIGRSRNLEPPLIGLLCSARIPPDLVLPAIEVVRAMTFAGSPAVGGFHTPVEKEWLRQLLEAGSRVVISRPRGLGQRRLPRLWEGAVRNGSLTIVSRFGPELRRPTIQSALLRNELVGALATAAFVAHATPGGMTHDLCRELVDRGVPVFTLDHPSNDDLLRIGAAVVRGGEEVVTAVVV